MLEMVETEEWGNMLLLDGMVMTSVKDEFVYHEMVAHVPLFTHPNPENVLVVGGMHAVEDYIMSRYQMYWQVYFHPVTRSAEVILTKILHRAKYLMGLLCTDTD